MINSNSKGTLYLLPSPISKGGRDHIPEVNKRIVAELEYFFVEKIRSARSIISQWLPKNIISRITFIQIEDDFNTSFLESIHDILIRGNDIGILTEAGYPCIADPGSGIVNIARGYRYRVIPLSGPSSLMLALSASGMNGQSFCFRGYLPIEHGALTRELGRISREVQVGITQIMIETPYRNKRLLDLICDTVPDGVHLSVGMDLTGEEEINLVKDISDWKHWGGKLDKPAVFILGQLV